MLTRRKQFVNSPDVIRQSRRHRRGFAVGAVDAAKVEVRNQERDGVFPVFELF